MYREGCHLCDDYLPLLENFVQKYNIVLIKKDVDSSFELYERYNVDVPAVVYNDKIIAQYFFKEIELLNVF
jgi:thiol-disulfide isomerase/thioredoxin